MPAFQTGAGIMRFYILIFLMFIIAATAAPARAQDSSEIERTLYSTMTKMEMDEKTHQEKLQMLRQKRNAKARARAAARDAAKARTHAQIQADSASVPYYLRTLPQ